MRYFGSRFVLSAADQQTSLQDWTFSAEASGLLHQEGLDPVMVAPLTNSISDRSSLLRHLKALAECLSEPLQSRAGQSPNGVEDLLDGAWIERVKAWIRFLLCR